MIPPLIKGLTRETIGAFQLESPAQRALQARLAADNMEDIMASVALIRPGPIQGNMVTFIARRHGGADLRASCPEPILLNLWRCLISRAGGESLLLSPALPGESIGCGG